jgi:hypothetical protein
MRISKNRSSLINTGLQPGDGRVEELNRFSGFASVGKPLKRLLTPIFNSTGLKPGVNEKLICNGQ